MKNLTVQNPPEELRAVITRAPIFHNLPVQYCMTNITSLIRKEKSELMWITTSTKVRNFFSLDIFCSGE
jgi:hypothetical protein